MSKNIKDYISVIIAFFIGALIAIGGSQNGAQYHGYPILFICLMISFVLHWIAFIPAYLARTEKFYDIAGTVAYLSVLATASYLTMISSNNNLQLRSIIAIILVLIWALRLGIFLFVRVLKAGEDRRFREVKQNFSKFLVWWSVSALWVFLTAANALTMIINNVSFTDDFYFYFGLSLWLIGFSFEAIADEQKRRFKSDKKNKDAFISTGLWGLSRHPNYFGEILLWVGMAVIALPTLIGWQYVTLISPIFIYFLLTRVSGVNLLEDRANQKWGGTEEYESYVKKTPVLIPFTK
jgi:steroid 5-alpha reductase family enzyme|tara:strand:+ start:490 stop:1371 length:882 start_codon:yes stop_codon:yes gene_type:complete